MSFYLVFKEPAIKYSPAYSIPWVPVVNSSSPRMCVCVCCVSLTLSQPTLSSAHSTILINKCDLRYTGQVLFY